MKKKFETVYIDIVGYCNAKCFYCHSGSEAISREKKSMDPDNLDRILSKLIASKCVRKRQVISLYNWGDPLLYPKFGSIVDVIAKNNLRFAISTNCSVIPEINEKFARYADSIMFSVSGFSNETYGRMHGFDFEKIKSNMVKVIEQVRAYSKLVRFVMLFHVYKYNLHELKIAEMFCNEHNVIFNPYYAILNHWWKLDSYIKGESLDHEKKKYEDELFGVDEIGSIVKRTPKGFHCPQFDMLNVDESGNVVTCCQIPKNHKFYSSGNLLVSDEWTKILENKNNHSGCNECMSSGLAYYINGSFIKAEFKRSYKQKLLNLCFRVLAKLKRFCVRFY
ncbi:MAG TPA: radical SAM protein [Candidatus Rifleibacterium sp.]|nr:radical SAM protein [Candidatus Rifleibacterium sp.]